MISLDMPISPGRLAERIFYFFYDNGLLAGRRYFIEAGAADGRDQSNTWALAQLGWRGLLIEASAAAAEICVQNRPESTVVHAALISQDYTEKTVELIHHPDHFLCNHIASTTTKENDYSFTASEPSPTRTLESILKEQIFEQIYFFSLDVEGYEFNVLDGLNLEWYRPIFLLVESAKLGALTEYLEKPGYELIASMTPHDHLFGRQSYRPAGLTWIVRSPQELPVAEEGSKGEVILDFLR